LYVEVLWGISGYAPKTRGCILPGEPIGTNPNLKLVGDGFGFVVYLSTSEIKPKRRKKR